MLFCHESLMNKPSSMCTFIKLFEMVIKHFEVVAVPIQHTTSQSFNPMKLICTILMHTCIFQRCLTCTVMVASAHKLRCLRSGEDLCQFHWVRTHWTNRSDFTLTRFAQLACRVDASAMCRGARTSNPKRPCWSDANEENKVFDQRFLYSCS